MNTVHIFLKSLSLLAERKLKSSFCCVLQGVSRDPSVVIGNSNLSRSFHCVQGAFLNHATLWVRIKLLAYVKGNTIDIFLKSLDLLSKQEVNSLFSAWSKEWVEIQVLTSARLTAVDVFQDTQGWNPHECWNWPYRYRSTTSAGSHHCHQWVLLQVTISPISYCRNLNENWFHRFLHDPRSELRSKGWHRQE